MVYLSAVMAVNQVKARERYTWLGDRLQRLVAGFAGEIVE